ncbi:TonB-dependent receptor domain-containing protein [Aquamicrobium defluvii]|uniref:TonB-dependent receptor-like beta-barrel domain-containing protein n=1 Tax=Aquamicrobium defluvii TaxID=69279 RepID=A0A011U1H4_9HYPH|nr:TonB-dependent receptor [Aquamicrobium defluvii]EXL10277.1 hypothetical protein BG36_08080 [Aquamicrobium defluvii]EZQ17054.1 hypothetical protein CF98_37640 [Halopseudomonas bauzanensis]
MIAGVNDDWYDTKRAEYFESGKFGEYPLFDNHALDWQAAAIWRPTADAEFHASISSRTRFPTFSNATACVSKTMFPTPFPAPSATNYETGASGTILDGRVRIGGAVFHSNVGDAIQSVPLNYPDNQSRFRNVGETTYYGFKLSGEWDVHGELSLGGNYAVLMSRYEAGGPAASTRPILSRTSTALPVASTNWRAACVTAGTRRSGRPARTTSRNLKKAHHGHPGERCHRHGYISLNISGNGNRQGSADCNPP